MGKHLARIKRLTGARVMVWDIETSPCVTTTWSLWPKSLSHDNILRDWYIISGAWKWAGEPTVYDAAINPRDAQAYYRYETDDPPDLPVVRALADAVRSADYLVAHNGDAFDLKKLNARVIHYGLEPIPPVQTVDTLKEIRKVAKMTSNRLDFLAGDLLPDGGKIKTTYGLWVSVLKGDDKALREMVRYNRRDVTELERVYEYLLPYMKTHPNVALGGRDLEACPRCGSGNTKRSGERRTRTKAHQQYVCTDCGAYSSRPSETTALR